VLAKILKNVFMVLLAKKVSIAEKMALVILNLDAFAIILCLKNALKIQLVMS
jgi:hypothetical protein